MAILGILYKVTPDSSIQIKKHTRKRYKILGDKMSHEQRKLSSVVKAMKNCNSSYSEVRNKKKRQFVNFKLISYTFIEVKNVSNDLIQKKHDPRVYLNSHFVFVWSN